MTSNEKLLDRYVRHQIYLIRYAGGVSKQVNALLKATEGKLHETLLSYLSKLEGRSLYDKRSRAILKELQDKVAEIRGKPWRLIDEIYAEEMQQLAVAEAASAAVVIDSVMPVIMNLSLPPVDRLRLIARSTPFEGKVLKKWVKDMAQADIDHINQRVKIGLVQNHSITQIARSIVPNDRDLSEKSVARKAMRDARSVALTVVSGISNQSRQALYEENEDVIRQEYFVATLDSKTTLICATNDGEMHKRGEGPIPPLHFRCRSIRIPLMSVENLGNRGFDPTTEKMLLREFADKNNIRRVTKRANLPYGTKTKFDEFARGRKRELVGQVPGKTSYPKWFERQSGEYQKDVLGPARYKMYKEGNMPLDGFVDYSGRTLTLNELRDKGLSVPD